MKKLATLFKGLDTSKSEEEEKKKLFGKGVKEWTTKDVSLWLKTIDLTEYCKEFEKADISGAELLELTEQDLIKDLKISKLGHRKRFKKQLEWLEQGRFEIGHVVMNSSNTTDDSDQTDSSSLSDHSNVISNGTLQSSNKCNADMTTSGKVVLSSSVSNSSLFHIRNDDETDSVSSLNGVVVGVGGIGGATTTTLSHVSSSSSLSSHVNTSLLHPHHHSSPVPPEHELWIKCYEKHGNDHVCGNSTTTTIVLKFNLACPLNHPSTDVSSSSTRTTTTTTTTQLQALPKLEQVKQEILSRVSSHQDISISQIQLKYKDEDNDMILLKKDEDFKICVQQYLASRTSTTTHRYLKLFVNYNSGSFHGVNHNMNLSNPNMNSNKLDHLTKKNHTLSSIKDESEELIEILDGMVDALIVMTAHDKLIKYVNKATESLLQFKRDELIGFNVTKIMPTAYRSHHDEYVDLYCKTGIPKIINKGRIVPVKSKQGKVFDCWLSVSDSTWAHQRAFTGTLKMIYTESSATSSTTTAIPSSIPNNSPPVFPFLENMVDGVIIISGNDDIVRYFNKSAEQMFGYTREEVVGQQIGMLVYDERVRQHHNQYVQRYMQSGDSHIVGIGRRVEALTKDGKKLPIYLSVNETKWNNGLNGRCFIGTTKLLDQNSPITKYVNVNDSRD
ncbi:hypothetical protein C9374_000864 [Naegleria lovaniensis]|uniref:SAM domain-containing protein n=1 Tax=Naegleria lovaniensis TaxID=51637 RepID=A0AA88KNG9_NAELO|nr:uncharacterized protein C9374_000864 [Naegleria lovaniensis]KAG2388014.1 hypothetical protein C9374_000864 [Naegleria lovaniensis]